MDKEQHVIDLIPAYAINCLDEEEAVFVEQHLVECAQCRNELRAYQEVAAQLAYVNPQVDPPASVKQRLMVQARASQASRTKSQSKDDSSWVEGLRRMLSPLNTRRFVPVWGIASLLLILILAISNFFLWRQVSDLRANPQPAVLQVVDLQGTETVPQGVGVLVISRDGRHGTLVVDNLPELDPDHEYQLWLIKDGQRTSGALFSVGEDGYGSKWVSSPDPLVSYSSFGVTIEPAGGSPGPTGEKVLGGGL
jgi:anti-sigma-K factor RskA